MTHAARLLAGKVRDLYDAGDGRLLMVASDRISAFDVVMAEPIPDKGRVLTAIERLLVRAARPRRPQPPRLHRPADSPTAGRGRPGAGGRMVVRAGRHAADRVHRARATWPARRGRSTGPTGTCTACRCRPGCGSPSSCPSRCSRPRPRPPAGHDENITFDDAVDAGRRPTWPKQAAELSPRRRTGGRRARRRAGASSSPTPSSSSGCIDGELSLADEVLTPDSSRFWPADEWEPGATPPSFDKQPVRDWLEATGWDKRPPPPALPRRRSSTATRARYVEAYERITGRRFADWPGASDGAATESTRHAVLRAGRGSPPPRHRRSPGRDDRAGAADARLRRRPRRHGRQGHPLHVDAADEARRARRGRRALRSGSSPTR